MADARIDPAVLANIRAGLSDATAATDLSREQQAAQQQLDFIFEEKKRKQTLVSRNVIAEGRLKAAQEKANEQARKAAEAAKAKGEPLSAPLDGLSQPVRGDAGGAEPANLEAAASSVGDRGGPQPGSPLSKGSWPVRQPHSPCWVEPATRSGPMTLVTAAPTSTDTLPSA